MIRAIRHGDKDQVLRLIKMFFKERLEKTGVTYDELTEDATFTLIMSRKEVLALCIEIDGEIAGLIAGIASSILFAKELAMQELVWYVEPSKRKYGTCLYREFELRAKARGFNHMMMVGMSGDPVISFYEKIGFTEIQRTFLKKV